MYEFLREPTVPLTILSEDGKEVVAETLLDEDCADLASLKWYENADDEANPYAIVELCGTSVHVHLNNVLMARHLGVAVVTGGVRPGGQCPNRKSNHTNSEPKRARQREPGRPGRRIE
jgi:hypothetical protein